MELSALTTQAPLPVLVAALRVALPVMLVVVYWQSVVWVFFELQRMAFSVGQLAQLVLVVQAALQLLPLAPALEQWALVVVVAEVPTPDQLLGLPEDMQALLELVPGQVPEQVVELAELVAASEVELVQPALIGLQATHLPDQAEVAVELVVVADQPRVLGTAWVVHI